jgi:hypothetical protein
MQQAITQANQLQDHQPTGTALSELIRDAETTLSRSMESSTGGDNTTRELATLALQCIRALKNVCIEERKGRKQERDARIRAEQELTQERAEKRQRKQLWRTKLKPAEKATIEEFQRQLDSPNAHRDENGFTRITFKTAGINIGMADKTTKNNFEKVLEQCPDLLTLAGAEVDTDREEYDPELKREIPRLYIKAEKSLVDAAINSTISKRKVQGGNQYYCLNPKCGSDNVRVDRRLVCLDCGHTSELEPTFPNGKLNSGKHARPIKTNLAAPPQTGYSTTPPIAIDAQTDKTNLAAPPQTGYTPDKDTVNFLTTSGQLVGLGYITSEGRMGGIDNLDDPRRLPDEFSQPNEIAQAAALLLDIAGTATTHIYMPRTGEDKYKFRHIALTLADLVDQLRAGYARGAKLEHQDGYTRALCFDTDSAEGWEVFQQVAGVLVNVGYMVLLEESPADRGGHLWVIFDALVLAAAARYHVCQVAPQLAEVREYWPYGPVKNQHVRLPAAKYVHGRVNAWCRLFCVATGEVASDGVSAARLLLASLTPASVVPDLPVIVESKPPAPLVVEHQPDIETGASCIDEEPEALTSQPVGADSYQGVRLPEVDTQWVERYGTLETTTCWFAVMPNYAAEEYNKEHDLEEIHPKESNGMAMSPNGQERTASTSYHKGKFYDHSLNGRRADGTHDSGDALELTSKVKDTPKPEIFRMTTGQIIAKARADLEAAARAGQPIPSWLEYPVCIVTPAGRRHYAELLAETQCSQGPVDHPQTEEQVSAIDIPQQVGQGDDQGQPLETDEESQRWIKATELLGRLVSYGYALEYTPERRLKRTGDTSAIITKAIFDELVAIANQYDSELREIWHDEQEGLKEIQREQGQGPATHKIGTCAACGSTKWYPHPTMEYICADCLEPIAYTREKELENVQPGWI